MDKKRVFLWSLYDFANSIVYINFLLYFGQWLVIDGGLSDFWYNAIFAIVTTLLLFSAPIFAAYTDKHGGRKLFLNISTVGTFVTYGSAAILAWLGGFHIFLITLLFLLGQYFYQLSFVFYNPMLDEISDETHRSRVSGIGQFSNSLGQVLGLVMTLPFSDSRLTPLLLSVVVFFIFALPMMILYKETRSREVGVRLDTIKDEAKMYRKRLFAFIGVSAAAPMLVAFFFFNDALITASNNYPIYMERIFAVPDSTKSLLLMSILLMSAVGGGLAGWIGDRYGMLKTLKGILLGWVIALPVVALATNFAIFAVLTFVLGLLVGSVYTITRAYLTTLLSKEEMGYGFSLYTLFERFATLVGPLAWGGIILALGTGASSYRIAIATMAVFVVIGYIILTKWSREFSTN